MRRTARSRPGCFPCGAVLLLELEGLVIAAFCFQSVAQSGKRATVARAAIEISAKNFFGFFELSIGQQDATKRGTHGRKPGRWLAVIECIFRHHGFVQSIDCLLYTSPSPRDRG